MCSGSPPPSHPSHFSKQTAPIRELLSLNLARHPCLARIGFRLLWRPCVAALHTTLEKLPNRSPEINGWRRHVGTAAVR